MKEKNKYGFGSILLLGVNSIIGSGIYLLPNQAMKLAGTTSIFIFIFDALLVACIALCFAEASSLFKKNGGPYVYAKEAFGEFVGFEVGFISWFINIVCWSTMSVGFVTALGQIFPFFQTSLGRNGMIIGFFLLLGLINILGVEVSKVINNISTIGKIVPLLLFVVIGAFFIDTSHFSQLFSVAGSQTGSLGSAAILVFYAFTGFESISIAAEDMENPEKNIPRAIISVLTLVSIFYVAIQVIAIGVLGNDLATVGSPIQVALGRILGPVGFSIAALGTLISIAGINIANSFITPRCGVALAEDGFVPKVVAQKNKKGAPFIAIILSISMAMPIALFANFATLASVCVVLRFTQYIPTCLSIIVFRKTKKDTPRTFKTPFGLLVPIVALGVVAFLVCNATLQQLLFAGVALLAAVPFYFIRKLFPQWMADNLK